MRQKHGGNIWACSGKLGTNPGDIIDFSASINQSAGFSLAGADMGQLETAIRNYPDPGYTALRERVGSFYGVSPENILPGNGSVELLYLVPRALKPRRVILPVPSFSEYERALCNQDIDIRFLPLSADNGFSVPVKTLVEEVSPGSMIILGNPNSPTGCFLAREALHELVMVCEKRKAWLCVDEAFIDFVPDFARETLVRESIRSDYLIVIRSFTKFFAIPGLRFGYMTGSRESVRRVREVQPPWGVNAVSEYAVLSILDRAYDISLRTLMEIKEEREYLKKSFAELPSLKLYPSKANFFLAEILNKNLDSGTLSAALLEHGIMIRDCAGFRGLDGRFIRFSVRSRKDNSLLLEKLREITG